LMVSLVDGHGYLQYNVSARAEICTFRAIWDVMTAYIL
jgi:hypothetical protein